MPIKEEQSTSRQHPVPQNVMDVEFKVVGDLTIRQLMYLFAGMVLVYSFYKTGLPNFWKYIFISITGALSIAIAFIPIQERGLDKWLVSFIKAMTQPTQMIWRKTYSPPAYFLSDYAEIIKNEIITLTPAKSRNKLDEYLGQLPESLSTLDKLESKRVSEIQTMFAVPYDGSLPVKSIPQLNSSIGMPTGLRYEEPITDTLTIPEINEIDEVEEKKPTRKEISKSEINSKMEVINATQSQSHNTNLLNQIDRVMTNLPKELKGEINIKTTTRIPKTIVIESLKALKTQESSLEKKLTELLDITKKAKTQTNENKIPNNRIDFFSDKFNKLKEEKESLSSQLTKSSSSLETMDDFENKKDLSQEISILKSKNEELSEYLANIQKELFVLKNPAISAKQQPIQTIQNKQTDQNSKNLHLPPQQRNRDATTTDKKSNIIQGVVKDKNGKLLENCVIIIKDSSGDVTRALKSNQLGQFKTQTPVQNGNYTIEAIKGGEKFDIISVVALGQPIDLINLIANE